MNGFWARVGTVQSSDRRSTSVEQVVVLIFTALPFGIDAKNLYGSHDSRVLRKVILGFSEEARTRGFPSLPFGGFGFIVAIVQA